MTTVPPVAAPPATRRTLRSELILSLSGVALAAAVLLAVRDYPTLSEGSPGPSLFPTLIGGLLAIFSILNGVRAVRDSRRGEPAAPADDDEEDSTSEEPEASMRRRVASFAVVVAVIVAFVLLANSLGYLLTMLIVCASVMLVLGESILRSLISAAALSVGMWIVFEKLLRVQLPDGLLW